MSKSKTIKLGFTELISSLALLISVISIYFTFFYKEHNLTLSVIDSNISYVDETISVDLLYHNQGNIYSTVIQEYLTFYQSDDWANTGVIFENGKHIFNIDYNPKILRPGEQYLVKIKTKFDFDNIDDSQRELDLFREVKIGLVSTYITEKGLRNKLMFNIGNLEFDSKNRIDDYEINYNIFELNEIGGFTGESTR